MINKLVNNTGSISGYAVQKDLPSYVAASEVIQNGENKITSTLDALSVQGAAMIKKPYFMLSKEQIEQIKEDLYLGDENEYTDEDISFIASYIFNIDKNSVIDRRINGIGIGLDYMKNCPKERKEKLYNSPAIRQIGQNIEDKGLKFSILTQIADGVNIKGSYSSDKITKWVNTLGVKFSNKNQIKLTELDALMQDDLVKDFTIKYLKQYEHSYRDYENFASGFEENLSTVSKFSKNEYASELYTVLKQRCAEDITAISKILTKRFENSDKSAIDQELPLIKSLLEAKTPDGEFIFGYSNASDNSEKRMFSGMENILDAKKNDLAKYEQLTELVKLTKKGKIPPYVIGILPKNANINPKFLSARKETYKSEESANTGDVFISDGKLKYRTGTEDIPIKMSKETFETLFSPVETMALSQGQLGDCYFVSAVYDFLKNPQAKGIIYNMFEEKNGDIIVTIPDCKEYPVCYPQKNLKKEGDKNVGAALGIQMLEDAYKQTRSRKYGVKNQMCILEGGNQDKVYDAFLNSKNSAHYYTGDNLKPQTDEIEKEIKDIENKIIELEKQPGYNDDKDEADRTQAEQLFYLLEQDRLANIQKYTAIKRCLLEELETSEEKFHGVNEEELLNILIQASSEKSNLISVGSGSSDNCIDEERLLYSSHAYSVLKVDNENKTIDIVNPWNTAQYVTITFDEFKKYFNAVSVASV